MPAPSASPPAAPLPAGAGPDLAAIAALDGAIAAAMPNFGPLVKDAENTYLKTAYMPLETLLEAVRPALLNQGVLITSSFQLVPGGFVVVTSLAHSGGGWRSSMFPVGDPSNPQKVAATGTYGIRCNLQQLLSVVATDDDGQAGAAPQQWQQPAPAGPATPHQHPPQGSWPAPGQQVNAPPATYPDQPASAPDPYSNALPPSAWVPPAAPASAPSPYV